VLHEITRICGLAGPCAKLIFKRRERTEPTAKLDCRTPERSGQMQPDHSPPSKCQPAAGDDKQHEARMNNKSYISEKLSNHACNLCTNSVAAPLRFPQTYVIPNGP